MKRWFWMAVGFGLGIAASRRRSNAATGDRGLLGAWAQRQVRDALAEGRAEAKRREATLRSVLAVPRNGTRKPDK